ncbi:glycosyltransferase [Sanyastnella coralliicola]|uniref:glycosyltransferase n=1 Tax=Sanyastnella coralliicola TaxID=3069118 RepID=UPI0027B9AAF7|nr:glycosyltransferase [Longitalea sp. SCSIO 12813]
MRTILMVLDAKYPEDIRVRKEIEALHQNFHVALLCSEDSSAAIDSRVTRLAYGPSSSKISKTLRDLWIRFLGYDRSMTKAIRRAISDCNPDVIHIHDLPQAATALRIRKNAKVVIDMHENYPEALTTWFSWRSSLLIRIKNRLIYPPSHFKKVERKSCKGADHVITVVEEMKTKLINDHQLDPNKITTISNYEPVYHKSEVPKEDREAVENILQFGSKSVTYVGGIGPHRGLDDMIRSAQFINDPEIHFYIVGSGNADNINHLRTIASDCSVEERVHFVGKVPFKLVQPIMDRSDVNIIPHKSNGHCDNTIPHKLFQIMQSSSSLLVSSSAPLKRIVETNQCGFIFEAENPKNCAEVIEEIFKNPQKVNDFIENGSKVTRNGNLNWESEGKRLVEFYKNLL